MRNSGTSSLALLLHVNYLVQRVNWVEYFRISPRSERKQLFSLSLAILHVRLLYRNIRGVVCIPGHIGEVQLLSHFLFSLLGSARSYGNTIAIVGIASVQTNCPTEFIANFTVSFRNHRDEDNLL